jgi:hypothetical protein
MFHASSKTGQAHIPTSGPAITSAADWRSLYFQGFATPRKTITGRRPNTQKNDHGLAYSQITLTLTIDPQANPYGQGPPAQPNKIHKLSIRGDYAP